MTAMQNHWGHHARFEFVRPEFVCFCSASERIGKGTDLSKAKWGHQASKRVIFYVKHRSNHRTLAIS